MSEVKLGDISFITKLAGFEHTKYIQGNNTHEKISADDVPLFIGKTVQNGKIDKNFDWYIPKELSNQLERSKLNKKCLVLPYVGSVGDLAIFDASYDAHLGSNIAKIELAENCGYSEEFIYYFLKSDYGQKILLRDIQGAIQKNITMKAIREVSLPDISIQEQNNIVSILKALDDKIQINNQINQELEAMAKTLYDYWFVQFDFPDQNGKPYKSSGGKMVYNPELKREIPEGWGVEKLGELIELERGVTYAKSDIVEKTTNDAIGVLRATNITGNVMDLNDLVYLTKDKINNKQILKQNETLIVMSSGSKEHLGKNAINYYEEVIGFGAFCSKIVPKKYSTYINTFLQSSEFKGYLLKQSMGTNINNLTNSDILDCRIILPNEEILDKFENMVEKNFKLISNNYIQNQQLTQLRDWLLPMLMNGQVKVE